MDDPLGPRNPPLEPPALSPAPLQWLFIPSTFGSHSTYPFIPILSLPRTRTTTYPDQIQFILSLLFPCLRMISRPEHSQSSLSFIIPSIFVVVVFLCLEFGLPIQYFIHSILQPPQVLTHWAFPLYADPSCSNDIDGDISHHHIAHHPSLR